MVADGWIKDPNSRNVLRFQRDPKDTYWSQQVTIDRGEPIPGPPALLKRRDRLNRKTAVKCWQQLRKAGWRVVESQ